MSYNKLKLTSVRIDPDTLEKLEKFTANHYYWTRNAVINNILTAVVNRFSENDIYDMVRTNTFSKDPITAVYRINQVPNPKEQ